MSCTCGEALVTLLQTYGVDTVFGIPGVHTVELYRGLGSSSIHHVTPRHEQGAGFMADGYARVTGRPGVCFIITGPGITNIATAMAQAFSDSIPMLVISSVNKTHELGLGAGQLHELPSQRNLTAQFTEFSHTLLDPEELPAVLARAFAVFSSRRPAPVHIEIPVDVIQSKTESSLDTWVAPSKPAPDIVAIRKANDLLSTANKPIAILGGGTVDATKAARLLIEKHDMPTINTVAAKGVLPASHALCLDATHAFKPVRELIVESDVVLAVGTEFSETDRYGDERQVQMSAQLIRIDIDPEQLARSHKPTIALHSDARLALENLLAVFDEIKSPHRADGETTVRSVKEELKAFRANTVFLEAVRDALPQDCIIAGDSTQPIYSANSFFPMEHPRCWITSVTGYGTLGYALPAAIGAKLAKPENPVACIVGDGGLLFTISELTAAVEQQLSIPIIIWNNEGYGEIRTYMRERNIKPVGVDLYTPDLLALARGFGCYAERAQGIDQLKTLLRDSFSRDLPTVIEVMEDAHFLQG